MEVGEKVRDAVDTIKSMSLEQWIVTLSLISILGLSPKAIHQQQIDYSIQKLQFQIADPYLDDNERIGIIAEVNSLSANPSLTDFQKERLSIIAAVIRSKTHKN